MTSHLELETFNYFYTNVIKDVRHVLEVLTQNVGNVLMNILILQVCALTIVPKECSEREIPACNAIKWLVKIAQFQIPIAQLAMIIPFYMKTNVLLTVLMINLYKILKIGFAKPVNQPV